MWLLYVVLGWLGLMLAFLLGRMFGRMVAHDEARAHLLASADAGKIEIAECWYRLDPMDLWVDEQLKARMRDARSV